MIDSAVMESQELKKENFDDIYSAPDPRDYYLTLSRYNYIIPDASKFVFARIYDAYRAMRVAQRLNIVDVGCSFGVNAALHKFGLSMSELLARYAAKAADEAAPAELRDDDERFFRALELHDDLVFTGLDVSESAIRYAIETRVLDAGVSQDLERETLTEASALAVEASDLIISTGAIGYVGRRTFEQLIRSGATRPWVATFVLRQYPFEPIGAMLDEYGYETEHLDNALFPQRRFVDARERQDALRRLRDLGRDPTPLEEGGWYAATFFLSRPREEARKRPLRDVLPLQRLPTATREAAAA